MADKITGPVDRGENAIGFGERTLAPDRYYPEPRPVAQIESEGFFEPTNEYDGLVKLAEENVAPEKNEYVGIVQQAKNEQKTGLQQSFFAAETSDPEQKAKVLQLSNKLNLPSSFVEKNYDRLSKNTLQANDYDTLITRTPGLATWLQKPDNAAVGKDDLEPLGKIDQATRMIVNSAPNTSYPHDLGQAAFSGFSSLGASVWSLAAAYGFASPDTAAENGAAMSKQAQSILAKAPNYVKEFNSIKDQELGDLGKAWQQFTGSFSEINDQGILKTLKDFAGGGISTVGDALSLLKAYATHPKATGYALAEMTPLGLASLPGGAAGAGAGSLASLATGPFAPVVAPVTATAGFLGGAFLNNSLLMVGSGLQDQLSKSGIDTSNPEDLRRAFSNPKLMAKIRSDAERFGLTSAAIQTVFQGFAGKFLAGAGPSVAAKTAGAAADIGVQSAGLSIADVGGQIAENKGDISKVNIGQSIESGILSLAHSVGTEVIGHSIRASLPKGTVEAAKAISSQAEEAIRTQHDAQALSELGQAVKESKVASRVPEKIAELINAAGGQDSKVYFQADDWDKYWSEKGVSPAKAAEEVLGDAASYHEAKQLGSPIEIPMADFVSKVGPTDNFEGLLPHVQTKPDGMNLSDANEFVKSLPATMEELAKEASLTPEQKSAAEVKNDVKQQLIEAGTLPADAEKQASLYEATFRSLGEKTGQDPKALFEQYKLKVGKPDVASLATEEEQVLNQSRADKENAAPFYHKIQKTLDEKMPSSASPDQVRGIIKDLKPEEIQYSGINDFLKGKKAVSKAELLDFLRGNQLEIKEVTKGNTAALREAIDEMEAKSEEYETGAREERARLEGALKAADYSSSDSKNLISSVYTADAEQLDNLSKLAKSMFPKVDASAYIDFARKAKEIRRDISKANSAVGDNATKFSKYTLPGGENYREVLLTLPKKTGEANNAWRSYIEKLKAKYGEDFYNSGKLKTAEKAKLEDLHRNAGNGGIDPTANYTSSHFDEPNIIAHMRLNDRVDSEGKKVLFIEEVQSDWHQEGRKKGYTGGDLPAGFTIKEDPTSSKSHRFQVIDSENRIAGIGHTKEEAIKSLEQVGLKKVPDAPFKKTWQELALKRIVREAAEKGYDKVAWTTGEQQAERYDLSKQIKEIRYHKYPKGLQDSEPSYLVQVFDRTNEKVSANTYKESQLETVVGKELAQKIANGEGNRSKNIDKGVSSKALSGLDLKIGGEGMKGFYDKILVDAANKLVKKYGGKVEDTSLSTYSDYKDNYEIRGSGKSLRIVDTRDNTVVDYFKTKKSAEEKLAAIQSGGAADSKVHSLELTPSLKEAALNEGFSLFQGGKEDPRGQIRFGNDRSFNIDLLRNADMSTFLHETGHFYLEVLGDVAKSDKATDQIKTDYQTVRDWLGAKEDEALTVKQHEQFARGFEAYFMEGKAPSSALKKAFNSFKIWLTNIYRSVKNLKVALTPEVRQVLDRLLATEDEINSAEVKQNMGPLFPDPIKSGMSESQAKRYIQARDDAKTASENELQAKILDDVRKKQTKEYKAKEEVVRSQVENEVNNTNLYKGIDKLKAGEADSTGQKFKLSKDAVVQLYGKEFVKRLPKGIFDKEGLHPDVAAELLQFESSDQMLTQMANAPDKTSAIEAQTKARMSELYPDLLTSDALPNEAMKAVHNDKQAQLLRMELEHLASNNMPVLKDVIRKVARRVPTEKQVRDQAERIIGDKNIQEIKPHLFERAEAKAAKEAGELLAKGDIDGAFEAKRKELLNHELYRSTVSAQEEIEKALKSFKRISKSDEDLSKSRDTDLVNAARALLSVYGIGKPGEEIPDSFLRKIKSYDEETYHTLQSLLEPLMEDPKPYDKLSYNEFSALKDTVDAMWSLSKSQKEIEINGQRMDRDQAIADLSKRFSEFDKPAERKAYQKAATSWEKTKMGLLGMRAALTRVEHWASAVDGGEKGNVSGPAHQYIYIPVAEGVAKFRLQKDIYLKKFLDLIKPIKEDFKKSPIRADELGYEFSGKAELLGALLHTGNESNKDKLLRGRGWEPEKFDAFIKRMQNEKILGKKDYDLVQSIWDLMAELKPEAQKSHKGMYGFYFNEITANEFDTPFGPYRGGYAPAVADSFLAHDAQLRSDKEIVEKFNNSWMFPTTGRGFTKGRVDTYAAPLQMDLRLVPGHLDKVLRFINIEPHVKDVGKIVMNRDFRNMLDSHDSTIASDMLVPWLQRSAQQKVSTPATSTGGRAMDTFWRELRSRTGMNVLVGSITNVLHQYTGLGTAMVLVEPKFIRNALWDYIRSPKQMSADMTEKSEFMRARSTHQTFELQATVDDILLNPTKYEQAKAFAVRHGYFVQQVAMNQVDNIVWSGAYNQAVEKGASEIEAVRSADSAIRRSQHTFNPEDISRFETGPTWLRAFTQFYSYFNNRANLLGSEFQKVTRDLGLKKGAGRALYIYTFGMLVPSMLHELIVQGARGKLDENDDDSYLDDFMNAFFGGQFRDATAMIPIAGPIVQAGVNRFNDKWYDDRLNTSPSVSAVESAVGAPYTVYKAIADEGSKKRAIQDSLTLLGLLTGFPTAPLSRPLGYLADVNEGKAEPTGPIDFGRGLLTGKSGK